jgi:hypothetical protein
MVARQLVQLSAAENIDARIANVPATRLAYHSAFSSMDNI